MRLKKAFSVIPPWLRKIHRLSGSPSQGVLTWNSPLLVVWDDAKVKPFRFIGKVKLSQRDTSQLAAGKVH